jgi:hypothetical protein
MKRLGKKPVGCQYDDCSRKATTLAYSRPRGKVLKVCDAHARTVADADSPEYLHSCENCGCLLPIN